jgi:hypothetical protein
MSVEADPPRTSAPSSQDDRPRSSRRSRSFLPRFGLRALFVFAILFCFASAWMGRNYVRMQEEDAAIESLKRAGASIRFEQDPESWVSLSETDGLTLAERLTDQSLRSIGWRDRPAIAEVAVEGWDRSSFDTAPDLKAAVAALPMLQEIRVLTLRGNAFDDSSIEALGRLPQLESLCLDYTEITDEGLSKLAAPERIQELVLWTSSRDTTICRGLSGFVEMRRLTVECKDLTREEVASIASLPKLERLDLSDVTTIGEDVFAPLEKAKSLQELSLASSDAEGFDDGDLTALADLPNLRELTLYGMTEANLAAFQPPAALRVFSITYGGVWEAARRFEGMEGTSLEAVRRFSAEHLSCEVRWRSLKGRVAYSRGGKPMVPETRLLP